METIEVTREKAEEATALLKALANENRLMVLCQLVEGEKSVGELGAILGIRQANLSQQLARLRAEGLVKTRREVKSVYYSLNSVEVSLIMQLLYQFYCVGGNAATITLFRDMRVSLAEAADQAE